jgi:hypothetical protein
MRHGDEKKFNSLLGLLTLLCTTPNNADLALEKEKFIGTWTLKNEYRNKPSDLKKKTLPCFMHLQINHGKGSTFQVFIIDGGGHSGAWEKVYITCNKASRCKATYNKQFPIFEFSIAENTLEIKKQIAISDESVPPALWGVTDGYCGLNRDTTDPFEDFKKQYSEINK